MSSVIYEKDQDNIVHLILDKPNAGANLMDNEFTDSLSAAVEQLSQDDYAGVIFRSAKSSWESCSTAALNESVNSLSIKLAPALGLSRIR
jgi:hypothetical protein